MLVRSARAACTRRHSSRARCGCLQPVLRTTSRMRLPLSQSPHQSSRLSSHQHHQHHQHHQQSQPTARFNSLQPSPAHQTPELPGIFPAEHPPAPSSAPAPRTRPTLHQTRPAHTRFAPRASPTARKQKLQQLSSRRAADSALPDRQ